MLETLLLLTEQWLRIFKTDERWESSDSQIQVPKRIIKVNSYLDIL